MEVLLNIKNLKQNHYEIFKRKNSKYVSVLDDVQYERKTNGVIGKDSDYGDVVMNAGIYEKYLKNTDQHIMKILLPLSMSGIIK